MANIRNRVGYGVKSDEKREKREKKQVEAIIQGKVPGWVNYSREKENSGLYHNYLDSIIPQNGPLTTEMASSDLLMLSKELPQVGRNRKRKKRGGEDNGEASMIKKKYEPAYKPSSIRTVDCSSDIISGLEMSPLHRKTGMSAPVPSPLSSPSALSGAALKEIFDIENDTTIINQQQIIYFNERVQVNEDGMPVEVAVVSSPLRSNSNFSRSSNNSQEDQKMEQLEVRQQEAMSRQGRPSPFGQALEDAFLWVDEM